MKEGKRTLAWSAIVGALLLFAGVFYIVFLGDVQNVSNELVVDAAVELPLNDGTAVLSSSYAETKKEAEERKKQLEKQKESLQKKIEQLTAEYENTLAGIEDMDLKLNDIMLDMMAIDEELEQLNKDYDALKEELSLTEKLAEEQYETMKKRLQYIYENGSTTYLEMILSSNGISDLLNQVEYVSKITQYDNNLLNRYLGTKRKILDYEAHLSAKIEAQNYTKQMYQADYEYAEKIISTKTEMINSLAAELGTNEEILEEYLDAIIKEDMTIEEAERKEAEAIKKAEEEKKKEEASGGSGSQTTPPSTGYGNAASIPKLDISDPDKMIWPLPGDSYVGSKFGPRIPPIAGASSYHKGVDIGGKLGADVVAAIAGTVYEAGWNSTGGYHVYIDHGNGYITRYLHLSKILVKKGEYVLQGEVVGLCGSTGVSTGPHLHFSVYKNGVAVDPLKYIHY